MGMLRFISRWLELYSVIRSALEPSSGVVGYGPAEAPPPYSSSPSWAMQSSSFSSTATYNAPAQSLGAGYGSLSATPESVETHYSEQRFSFEASSAYYSRAPNAPAPAQTLDNRAAPPEAAAALAYCESCINEALAQLLSYGDGDLEEFLPQLANLFLGCAEPPASVSSSSSSSMRNSALLRADHPWESWQRALVSTWTSLGQESDRGSNSVSFGGDNSGNDMAFQGRQQQSQWSGYDSNMQPQCSSAVAGEQQLFSGMRQQLEQFVLQRCAQNPSLAIKLAWLLDDVAGSPKSSQAVAHRARSAAYACRQGIARSAARGTTTTSSSSDVTSISSNSGAGIGSTSSSTTDGSSSCQEAAGLIHHLMAVSHKLGIMKAAKVCSRPALVQVAKSWLAWINRDYSLKLAAKLNAASSSSSAAAASAATPPIEYLNNEAAIEAHLASDVSVKELAQHALPLVVLPGEFKALRFLRLLPDETVVLNSASRAPFMFVAEVLEDPCNVSTASAVGVGTKEGSSIEEGSSGAIDSVNNYQLRRVSDHDYELLAKKTKACVVMPLNDDGTGTSTGNEDDVVNAIGGAISSTGGNTLVQRSSTSSFVDALMAGRFSTNQIALPQQQACAAAIHSGFGELWSTRVKRLKDNSPYGHLPGWRCVSFMVKSRDDLRIEGVVMQAMRLCAAAWQKHQVDVYVRPYSIVCCGDQCGVLENVATAKSWDSIKKGTSNVPLRTFFAAVFCTPQAFLTAQREFMRSLVPYSILTYLFQVKDRHNGNILVDTSGHCLHIDFGYLLGASPGGNLGWERSPFKLPMEFVDLLDGLQSPLWREFEDLIVAAFMALQPHAQDLCALVEASFPVEWHASKGDLGVQLKRRLMQSPDSVRKLVRESVDNWTTKTYDLLQRRQNGILC